MAAMLMRRRKTALMSALAATVTAAALLTGCSSDKSSEALPDAAELLSTSAASTAKVTSAHLEVNADGEVKGLPVKTLTGDLTNIPATAAKGNAAIYLGGQTVDVQFVVLDAVLYGSIDNGQSFSDYGPAADIYDPSTILNPDLGLANTLSSFTDAKSEAAETIGGVETVRITGKVSSDAVNKLLPDMAATGPVDGTAWIAKDGDHNLVQARISPDDKTHLDMTLSAWNEPVTVTKPAL